MLTVMRYLEEPSVLEGAALLSLLSDAITSFDRAAVRLGGCERMP